MSWGSWKPMAPALTVQKGEFSFLIALGKQLDRALEMCYDGSAPDFVVDAVGVLANALDGIAGASVGDEEASGGDDDVVDSDDDSPGGLQPALASGDTGERGRTRTVGGALRGTRPMTELLPQRYVKRMTAGRPKAEKKGGKRRGAKR